MNKHDQVKNHLAEGFGLTPMEAMQQFRSMRLATIVDLLRESGVIIYAARARNTRTKITFAFYYEPDAFMAKHMEHFSGRFGTGLLPGLTAWMDDRGWELKGHYNNRWGQMPPDPTE